MKERAWTLLEEKDVQLQALKVPHAALKAIQLPHNMLTLPATTACCCLNLSCLLNAMSCWSLSSCYCMSTTANIGIVKIT